VKYLTTKAVIGLDESPSSAATFYEVDYCLQISEWMCLLNAHGLTSTARSFLDPFSRASFHPTVPIATSHRNPCQDSPSHFGRHHMQSY
jgi:hypothetical protein